MNPLIRAEISATALRANLARIRGIAPSSRLMAVVKANAYGHGLVHAAQSLADADGFGVARLHEALTLREAGVLQPITLLEGVFDSEQMQAAAHHRLDIVVQGEEQLQLLEHWRGPQSFVVWLKVDTGMNRLGWRAEQFASALARVVALGARVSELRLMTHFAAADEEDSEVTAQQIALFDRLTQGRSSPRSLCNSAGVFTQPGAHAQWIRPGLSLYGVSPFAEYLGHQLGLTPVMRLLSSVIAVREVRAGESVGYGGAWYAQRDARVAILAAGYGDGVPRMLPNGTPVLVNGQRAETVGRVSMDMMAVELARDASARVGDTALLWGPGLPVEEIAAYAGTIPYELLCRVTQRVASILV